MALPQQQLLGTPTFSDSETLGLGPAGVLTGPAGTPGASTSLRAVRAHPKPKPGGGGAGGAGAAVTGLHHSHSNARSLTH